MPPNRRSREWIRWSRISRSAGVAVPVADRGEDRRMLAEDLPKPLRPVGHQRLAVQLHADIDMLAQRPHRRLEILVVRRLGDGEVKGEVGVLAVGLRVGRPLHQRKRRRDLLQRLRIAPHRREPRRHRLDADAELVATLDVGDRLDPREAERHGADLAHIAAGALARMDEALIPQPLQRRRAGSAARRRTRRRASSPTAASGSPDSRRSRSGCRAGDRPGRPGPASRAARRRPPPVRPVSVASFIARLPVPVAASTTATRASSLPNPPDLVTSCIRRSPSSIVETGTPGKTSPSIVKTP